jgi:hypothetical protein
MQCIAAVSHPFFKLRWVPKERKNYVKELLVNEAESLLSYVSKTRNDTTNTSEAERNESFFAFEGGSSSDDSVANTSVKNTVELECLQYLQNEDTCLDSLKAFALMQENFIKYNTALSSSAVNLGYLGTQVFTRELAGITEIPCTY